MDTIGQAPPQKDKTWVWIVVIVVLCLCCVAILSVVGLLYYLQQNGMLGISVPGLSPAQPTTAPTRQPPTAAPMVTEEPLATEEPFALVVEPFDPAQGNYDMLAGLAQTGN